MPRSVDVVRKRSARRLSSRTFLQRFWNLLVGLALGTAIVVLVMIVGAAALLAQIYADTVDDLPSPEGLAKAFDSSNNEFFLTTRIYDRTGENLLYDVIDPRAGDRIWMGIEDVPVQFVQATIAIEDKTFYENPGYDLEGILRAFLSNVQGGAIQGGSTITQQLIKNVIISPNQLAELSYRRKLQEILIAIEATKRYGKHQILEWYLNTNFYGNMAYGVDAAARVYFGKSAAELDLSEISLLAAIPQFPALNPLDAPLKAKQRQELVLTTMQDQGYISALQAQDAARIDVISRVQAAPKRFTVKAPHFTFYALREVLSMLDSQVVFRGGLSIYTTLDLDLQNQSECVARTHVERLSGGDPHQVVPASGDESCVASVYLPAISTSDFGVDHNLSNAAVVIIDPRTGEILAMVGSLDYWNEEIDGYFNVAADGLRQPGSVFKPFTYLTAFSQGYTPASMVLDVRTAFPNVFGAPYVPENYDLQFHGPVSIRAALANSYNVPAVQVMNWVGVDNVIRTAHRMGINSLDRGLDFYGPALTLGGGEVTLLDLGYSYGVLAHNGVMSGNPVPEKEMRSGYRSLNPVTILRIDDSKGETLMRCGSNGQDACQFVQATTQPVLSPELSYLMTHVLSDEVARSEAFGRPNSLEIGRPAAVKTGTTDDFIDSWTVGYIPQLVTAVWVGNSDSSPMGEVSGLTGAAPIWNAVMMYAAAAYNLPPVGWDRPSGIRELRVCYPSGLLPTEYCQEVIREVFVAGTEPVAYDNIWQAFQVNRETGKLATVYTPRELVEEKVYQILPAEAADWMQDAGVEQPSQEYDTVHIPREADGGALIASPRPFSYVRGKVSVEGTASGDRFQFYRLQYGSGLNPSSWSQIGDDQTTGIQDGVLQEWDTASLSGLYSLQLLVVHDDQQFGQSTVHVTVDNKRPLVGLVAPVMGEVFSLSDESIIIQPDARDDLSLAYVEIFVDNFLVANSRVAPFTTRWQINEPGHHSIHVRAVDAAGNTTKSEDVTILVLHE